jgi:hypothetical protein
MKLSLDGAGRIIAADFNPERPIMVIQHGAVFMVLDNRYDELWDDYDLTELIFVTREECMFYFDFMTGRPTEWYGN